MKAVILAGGMGTRLKTITGELPKPMVPVAGKPLLVHLIELCKKYGIQDIHLTTGYRGEWIREQLKDGSQLGVSLFHHIESKSLGTAGSVKAIEDFLKEDFLLIYGDVFVEMDLNRLLEFHKNHPGMGTLTVHPNNHPFESDLLELDENRIVAFHPKPHPNNEFFANIVNAGVAVLSSQIFKFIPPNEFCDFGHDIFPKIISENGILHAYNTPEYLKDLGTPERYERVNKDYISGKISRLCLGKKRKAVFIDRDGTLNKYKPFLHKISDFELYPGTEDALKKLNETEFLSIVVSNQPQLARGLLSFAELKAIHNKMETLLGKKGARIDALYFCPHHPDKGYAEEVPELKIDCLCRKPGLKMYQDASARFNIDLSQSVYIGDSSRDIYAGTLLGGKTVLLKTGEGGKDGNYPCNPSMICKDLFEAVNALEGVLS